MALERLQDLLACRLQRVDPEIDGRPRAQGCPFLGGAGAEGALEGAHQPIGNVAGDRAGASAGSGGSRHAVSSSVSGGNACSEPSANAATSAEVTPKARGAAPSARARGVSAPICAAMELRRLERVVNEGADGGAVAGTGEAVGFSPVGKRHPRGAMALKDVLEHLGGGAQPGAWPHRLKLPR